MRPLCRQPIELLLVSFTCALTGCAPEDQVCPVPKGQFQFDYLYMSGTCSSAPAGHPIKLEPGANGIYELRENRSGDQVNTTAVYKGCDVSVEYTVSTKPDMEQGVLAATISYVRGDMVVDSDSELSGVVTRIEYSPPGEPACQGEYAATLRKNDSTIGAAAD